jgi:hypothetical protein
MACVEAIRYGRARVVRGRCSVNPLTELVPSLCSYVLQQLLEGGVRC